MPHLNEPLIQAHEKQLKDAMLNSDVKLLDHLLAPGLIFTNHLGQIMSKADDLNMHSSGMLKIDRIELSDEKITFMENAAVVTALANIEGSFAGEKSDAQLRFTRVWQQSSNNNNWQVVVAHSCMIHQG